MIQENNAGGGHALSCGAIRQIGRVTPQQLSGYGGDGTGAEDTIYSKIARLNLNDVQIILLDTPTRRFHAGDRTDLPVLDYCILVINGADGVTAQTRRLWICWDYTRSRCSCLSIKRIRQLWIPGKSMRNCADLSEQILTLPCRISFNRKSWPYCRNLSWRHFLKAGPLILRRSGASPAANLSRYFGSALKDHGVEDFLKGLVHWTLTPEYPEDFSARVYKITREENQRLTFLKITGGTLKNKSLIGDEKINEIRLYSGDGFAGVQSAAAGEICGVTGLKETRVGQILGDGVEQEPAIFPILSYRVHLLEGGDEAKLIRLLLEISEELPIWVSHLIGRPPQSMSMSWGYAFEVLQDLLERRGHEDQPG